MDSAGQWNRLTTAKKAVSVSQEYIMYEKASTQETLYEGRHFIFHSVQCPHLVVTDRSHPSHLGGSASIFPSRPQEKAAGSGSVSSAQNCRFPPGPCRPPAVCTGHALRLCFLTCRMGMVTAPTPLLWGFRAITSATAHRRGRYAGNSKKWWWCHPPYYYF